MKTLLGATLVGLALVLPTSLHANTFYVDAKSGVGGNTTLAGGSVFTPPVNGTTGNDNNWEERTVFASGGNVFESGGEGAGSLENAPMLRTTISGLTPGSPYQVYVNFWDPTSGGESWSIRAGLTSNSSNHSYFSGTDAATTLGATAAVLANTLTYTTAPTLYSEGGRAMWAGLLGTTVANGSGQIQVYIDDRNPPASGGSIDRRSWYDGLSYRLAGAPSPAGDEDNDGLTNSDEQTRGTNIYLADTDGDGFNDGVEVAAGSDPLLTSSVPGLSPAGDEDGDGLSNGDEQAHGTNPYLADTDGDGFSDSVEVAAGSDPLLAGSVPPLDPAGDEDDDGLSNGDEVTHGTDPYIADTDGDTYTDGSEVNNGSDPLNPASTPSIPKGALEIAPDGAWTWFNDERAIFHQGSLFSGYVRRGGRYGITRYDPATNQSFHMIVSTSASQSGDDHNNPSITPLADGRLLIVYSKHSGAGRFYYRTSNISLPSTDADWGPEMEQTVPASNSYANTYRLTGESNAIYNFHRSINFNPTITISTDNGATWGASTHFIKVGSGGTRPYPRYCSNHTDRIDLIYTDGHPRDVNNSIYHLSIRPALSGKQTAP